MRGGVRLSLIILLLAHSICANAGEIRKTKMRSEALGRDLAYSVYLPDNYPNDISHYPVLYLLHGADGNETTWLRLGKIKTTADKLVAAGSVPPVIIVMPGCRRCWWVNGTRDQAESAFLQDLVPHIERNYPVLSERQGRFVAGISAGGQAAIRFSLKNPGRFAAAAALSPAIYNELPPKRSAARRLPPFLGPGGKFLNAAWRAQNYPSFLPDYFAQPLRVRMYLMSGDNDRLGIAYETAFFFKQLFEHQPEAVELRVIDGGHHWRIWSESIAKAMVYMLGQPLKPDRSNAR